MRPVNLTSKFFREKVSKRLLLEDEYWYDPGYHGLHKWSVRKWCDHMPDVILPHIIDGKLNLTRHAYLYFMEKLKHKYPSQYSAYIAHMRAKKARRNVEKRQL